MILLVGSFTSRNRRVPLVGDILCLDLLECRVMQGGRPLFVHRRSIGGIIYRRGVIFDLLLFEGDKTRAKFRVWPSDVWGSLGSRFAVGAPFVLRDSRPASRAEMGSSLRELGWLND